ncbi:hypothetical protein ACQ4PT_050281 [Festuca glaucescens]
MDGSMSWVPDGMDSSSTIRIDVRVCAYAEFVDNGTQVWHSTRDELKVLDRNCVNFKDFSEELDQEIKHGLNQKLLITFWDKVSHSFEEINLDTSLLTVIDMYWDERRLPIMVSIVCKGDSNTSACVPQLTAPLNQRDKQQQQQPTDNEHDSAHSEHASSSSEEPPVLDDWVDAEVEYVGVDDECEYKELLSDSDDSNLDDGHDADESFHDDLFVDDTVGCETIVHVTDFENPKIEVGVTFEDGKSFKKAIRQYAVKGEYEIAAPYSEATRYRGYCKAKRCKWRTWQIKKMPREHNCGSIGTVDKNCMENNHWTTPSKASTLAIDIGSPVTRSRKKQLGLDATAMRKTSKVVAKPKAMKKTTRKLEVKKAKK